MSWKKACLLYCIALVVTALCNIEKVSVWADDHLADTPVSFLSRDIRHIRNFWRESSLGAASHTLDCDLAPFFDETYKDTLTCRQSPSATALARAQRQRLDPKIPVLKADLPIDTKKLLAALTPPEPPGTVLPAPSAAAGQTSLVRGKGSSPHKILVVGDSLAIGLSLSLRRRVATLDGVQLIEEGKVSSGLANPRYYDWNRALRVFLDKYTPDVVVVMMGANDAKYINPNEKPRPPGSLNKSWPQVFTMRVESFLAALTAKNVPSYWIGLPIMGDPTYAKQTQVMNAIIKAACAKARDSHFLDTWNLLADAQGKYSTFLPNDKGVKIKVRANDKIHFTVAGGDILAKSFLTQLAKDVELRPKSSPQTAGRSHASASVQK